MRKYIKKILLEAVEGIQKANRKIEELVGNGITVDNAEQVLSVLTAEQETAVMIGEEVDKAEGEGTKLVKLLEEYCELLWAFSQTSDEQEHKRLLGRMNVEMTSVHIQLHDLPEQYDVVFLPYKASMWDCMESVWMAAKEDPDCNCYVIPIPYNDMNEDGTRGTLRYEGELFPKYVPITSYEEYKIAEVHPEVIYIHNPYDQYNRVTNVAEDFFSSNLRNYTDMLVYIPYYFTAGRLPEDHSLLVAYVCADKIVVQSEGWIEDFDEQISRDKIVALGSPKVDRVLRLARDKQRVIDEEISPEWKEKVINKKVILYNTSLNSMLADIGLVLKKMRYVFSKFEKRDDIVLLWRPHPLMESTLRAMRNTYYDEYMRLKNDYIKAGYGIIDETADPAVSSVIADAYIGETNSSLVNYFGVQGKLIYFLNFEKQEEHLTKEERAAFRVGEVLYKDSCLYYTPREKGLEHCLYKTELESGKVEKVLKMPGIPAETAGCSWGAYANLVAVKDKIILPPYNTEDMYIYDSSNNSAIRYILPEVEGCNSQRFSGTVMYNDKIFLIPKFYPAILECDIENVKFTLHKEWIKEFTFDYKGEPTFILGFVQRDNLLYMAASNEAKMLIFSMDDATYEVRSIGEFDYGFYSMIYDGEDFWLSGWKQDVVIRWNEKTGISNVYYYQPDNKEYRNKSSVTLFDNGESIVAFHLLEHLVFGIDKKTGEIKRHLFVKKEADYIGKKLYTEVGGYAFVKQLNDEWVSLFDIEGFSIILWNRITDEQKIYPCRLPDKDLLELEKTLIEGERIGKYSFYRIYEANLDISMFLDYIANNDAVFEESVEAFQEHFENFGNAGEKIHEYIKELIS